jgi:hypothetical protein
VPDPGAGLVEDPDAWVEMVHPDFDGHQLLPNNPDALFGAREAGWVTAAEAAALDTDALTVAEVLAAVGEDPAKAAAALDAEVAGKARKSLISALSAIAESSPTAVDVPVAQDKE